MDCGLAGTVLRFVPPLAALAHTSVIFDGDAQARARPIAPPASWLAKVQVSYVDLDRVKDDQDRNNGRDYQHGDGRREE